MEGQLVTHGDYVQLLRGSDASNPCTCRVLAAIQV